MAVARRTEAGYQRTILQLARLLGWRVYHTHDSRRSAAGYPDLTLCRGDRLIFCELKSLKGRTSPEQRAWLDALRRVPGVEVYEFRDGVTPWQEVEGVLR